jgi:uncharacterized protein (TIGR00730 family)
MDTNGKKTGPRVVLPAYEEMLDTYVARLRDSKMSPARKRKCAVLFAEAVEAMDLMASTGKRTIAGMGSAREPKGTPKYERAVTVARLLAPHYNVIQGEGPGFMEAFAFGAQEGGALAIGLRIIADAIFEQVSNPHTSLSITFHDLFARKFAFLQADGYVFFDYGIGTLDEFFEVLAQVQLGLLAKKPVVCVGVDAWGPIQKLLKDLAEAGRISWEDLDLFRLTDDPEEVLQIMLELAPPRPNGCSGSEKVA